MSGVSASNPLRRACECLYMATMHCAQSQNQLSDYRASDASTFLLLTEGAIQMAEHDLAEAKKWLQEARENGATHD